MSDRKPTIAELEMMLDSDKPLAISILPDGQVRAIECHRLDSAQQVFFYENDFYVLSNFSSFRLFWADDDFDHSEAAYHCEKFPDRESGSHNFIRYQIKAARSAHDAFKIAEAHKHLRRPDWDEVKVGVMRRILREKALQHEYVRTKLLATGDRELIEDSWRDDYWGWGPNRDGQNMLGKLWMEIRAELRASLVKSLDDVLASTEDEGTKLVSHEPKVLEQNLKPNPPRRGR